MARYDRLAFDVLECDRRFQLRWAKFPWIADAIHECRLSAGRSIQVLDVGVGRARIERIYEHRHAADPVEWHGVDLLRWRLELSRTVPGIREVQANLEVGLPYRDAIFDVVVSSWLLQHVRDPRAAVSEMARVLRPGGCLMLAVPSAPQPLKAVREIVLPPWVAIKRRFRHREYSYRPQIQYYNLPRVRRIVEGEGLEPIRWQGMGFVTGGPIGFLENYRWYYDLHVRLGAILPRLTQVLVCIARKPGGPPSDGTHDIRGRG